MKGEYHLPVLMYHQVLKSKKAAGRFNTYVFEKNLRKQFLYLKKEGYQTITFKDLKTLDPAQRFKKVILTFDDGYLDNYEVLFPLLKEFGFTAVIFMVTGLPSNTWSAAQGEPVFPLMNSDQIKEMDAHGIEFGGHTQTHVNFDFVSPEIAKAEIIGCKNDLEKMLQKPVLSFAYPFGAIHNHIKQIVKEAGYHYGIATNKGPENFDEDLYQIKRMQISYRTTSLGFKLKVSGHYYEKFQGLLHMISRKGQGLISL